MLALMVFLALIHDLQSFIRHSAIWVIEIELK